MATGSHRSFLQRSLDVVVNRVRNLLLRTISLADKLSSQMCPRRILKQKTLGKEMTRQLRAHSQSLFKHLISVNFPMETSFGLVQNVLEANMGFMIILSLDESLESLLERTVRPNEYNKKVASLVWLFSHISAYCTLRELDHGYVQMGDSPSDMHCDGIYVFDQGQVVGFRLSRSGAILWRERGSKDSTAFTARVGTPNMRPWLIRNVKSYSENTQKEKEPAKASVQSRESEMAFPASSGRDPCQSADLILVDQDGFVNSKVLLAVLLNIAFKGRKHAHIKHAHITSHVTNTAWLNKVADIQNESRDPAYHVVSQSFKQREESRAPVLLPLGLLSATHFRGKSSVKILS
ncbi:hypothetical protein CRENBAI_010605 [Crenichthys baileyi]|uniref:Uncharacterized protein n=1 Tax=Crenichthys baileyi TaxID=28760 RepID=A0AAV9QXB4_9TELE